MTKSPLLLSVSFTDPDSMEILARSFPDRPVIDWTHGTRTQNLEEIRYALCWQDDPDLFKRMPNLQVVFSAGAGVDKILANPSLPGDMPIVRFVDDSLTNRMSEWVVLQCLMHLRQQRAYDGFQRERNWQELRQPQAGDVHVGIMGLGVLGRDAALKLKAMGFQVSGWSRTKKQVEGIECFDASETDQFLEQCHYLVGLLPLTDETRHFFSRSIFEKLAKHPALPSPVFLNAGRGASQNEADLIACLEDGTLGAASIDVFETEPLPVDNPLWGFDNVILSPHMAATSQISALGEHVARQIARHEAGEGLQNLVDRALGY